VLRDDAGDYVRGTEHMACTAKEKQHYVSSDATKQASAHFESIRSEHVSAINGMEMLMSDKTGPRRCLSLH